MKGLLKQFIFLIFPDDLQKKFASRAAKFIFESHGNELIQAL